VPAPASTALVVRGERNDELDGLRFVLVIAIFFTHAGLGEGGWPAVDTFFVLSGFLIASLLIDDSWRPRAFRAFVTRRVRRLAPAFLVCVMIVSGLLLLGVVSVTGPADQPLQQALWSVLYIANWHEIWSGSAYWANFGRSPFGHLWSLSIEEQFYFLFPILMIGIRRLRLGRQALVCGVLALASASWAIWLGFGTETIDRIYYGTDTRAFALLAGATAGLLAARPGVRERMRARRRLWTVLGVAAFVGLIAINALVAGSDPGLYRGGLQGTTLLEVVLVVSLAVGNPLLRPILRWRPLVWAGHRSYSIYLWHLPVFAFVPGGFEHPWRTLLIGAPIATALGALTYTFVEQTFLRPPLPRAERRRPRPVALTSIAATIAVAAAGLAYAQHRVTEPTSVLDVESATPAPLDGAALAATRQGAAGAPAFAQAAPTTAPPVKHLMVIGDSMAVTFANVLQIPGMEIINNGQLGCGSLDVDRGLLDGKWQARSTACRQWRDSKWGEKLPRADATLWMWGAWDLYDVEVGGQKLYVGSPEYQAFLQQELARAADQLTADGRRLFITAALCFDDNRIAGMNHRAALQNEQLKAFADSRERVEFLPLDQFLCRDGKPVKVNGEAPRPDGVHFSTQTSILVWAWLMPYLLGTKSADAPTGIIGG